MARNLEAENSKFFIYFDHVVDQNGLEVPNYLVVSPKILTGNRVAGVAILPVFDGKVGLVRIYRPAMREYSLEIPHGFVEESEENQSSAIRELAEETGLLARTIRSLGYLTPDAGIIGARVHLFVAEHCEWKGKREGELGLGEFQLFTEEEFEDMIRRSVIQDSFTLAAWCKYRLLRDGGPESEQH